MSQTLIEDSNSAYVDDVCKRAGLSVYRKPEWTHISPDGNYRFTISLLGGNIIYTRPFGYAARRDLKNAWSLIDEVVEGGIPADTDYIQIADYSFVRDMSADARKFHIERIRQQTQLKGLYFYGMSALLKLSIRIALRFNIADYEVKIADGFSEALEMAFSNPAFNADASRHSAAIESSDSSPAAFITDRRADAITHRDWSVNSSDFSAQFEILCHDIFHWASAGNFKEQHIDPIFEINEQAMATLHRPKQPYYYLLGVEGVTSSSFKSRREYTARIRDWHERYPFKMFVFYGANRLLRAAIGLTKPFVPFKVAIADSLDSALKLIDSDRISAPQPSKSVDDKPKPISAGDKKALQRYADEIIHYLGSVNWDADASKSLKIIDVNHPFSAVFDAINLIKGELDEQLIERKRSVEENTKLSEQLQRMKRLESIGALAGGVAHDLNNVLSGIISYPEILLMDLPKDSPMRRPLLSMQESGHKAAAIVQDLQILARREIRDSEVFNLNDVVSAYLKSPECEKLRSYYPAIHIESKLSSELLNIDGARGHISKSIINLVSNGAEAIGDSGDIVIETENLTIDQPIIGWDAIEEGDYVILSVSDTGAPLSSQDIDRVFEPFYTKKVMGRSGTGLGMAVVYGTVKDNGGFIDIDSKEGKGTVFSLYFPATRKAAKDESAAAIDSCKGRGETILVIDDMMEQREIATRMLERLGYKAVTAASGEKAIAYLKSHSVDLLLLDMIMEPGMDGLDTYRRILERHPGQKAIIASGYAETYRVKEARKLGVGNYIKKPYMMETLGMAVRGALDGHRPAKIID